MTCLDTLNEVNKMSDFLLDITEGNYLAHHGIKGQKWGERRYQNPDGSLTDEGRKRYGRSSRPALYDDNGKLTNAGKSKLKKTRSNLRGLEDKVAKSQYAYERQKRIADKDLSKIAKGKDVDTDKFTKDTDIANRMKADYEKDLSNYKKYADYALNTFGDKKIKTMTYGSNGTANPRLKDDTVIAGAAVAGGIMGNPVMLTSFALLPTMIKDNSYTKKKAKYEADWNKSESERKQRHAQEVRDYDKNVTQKKLAELRKDPRLKNMSDRDLIDYYMD